MTKIWLLPRYFKFIGIALLVMALVAFVLQEKAGWFPQYEDYRVTSLLMLLGLTVIAFSKEKIEDERVQQVRLSSFAASFLFIVFSILLNFILDFFDWGVLSAYDSVYTVMLMLVIYLMNFIVQLQREY